MRAEDTLQFMADFYPDIFPTRKHALDHLFCVVGNGYDWINGELTCDGIYERRYKMIEHVDHAEFRNEAMWKESYKFFHEFHEDGDKIPLKYQWEWYPLDKKYSNLYTYPEDIKPDWKALLEECKQLLKEDGIEV